MDLFEAVFNRHKNNAHEYAVTIMGEKCPGYLAVVRKREKEGNGIMAIFKPPHRAAFTRYAKLVQSKVNSR